MFLRYQVLKSLTNLNLSPEARSMFDGKIIYSKFPSYHPETIRSCLFGLRNEDLIHFLDYRNGIFYDLKISPTALEFLYNQHEIAVLTTKEKWENRFYGFIAGLVTAIAGALVKFYL